MDGVQITTEEFEKLQVLLQDKAFAKHFSDLGSLEEMQMALKEQGVDLTPEQIFAAAAKVAYENQNELDESLLDYIAGGKTVSFWIFEFNFQKPSWWPW